MADPQTTHRLLILLGDGATPTEAFAHPCGANSANIKLTNNLGEETVLDCDDPLGAPAIIIRHLESQDSTLSLSGVIAKDSFSTWRSWADDGTPKNVRVLLDESLADNGGYWTIPCLLQDFEMGRENKKSVTFTASLMAAGRRVWTAAAA